MKAVFGPCLPRPGALLGGRVGVGDAESRMFYDNRMNGTGRNKEMHF